MAKRLAFLLVECFVALILIVSAALFWASYYIDTTEFRDLFTNTLKTALSRDVNLVGELDIAVWPELALEVSNLDVGEASAFGEGIAAHFDEIRIKVRVIPLFSKQLEVDSIVVNGFNGVIVQNAEGDFNWESVMVQKKGSGLTSSLLPDWAFSVHSVEILGANILFKDEMVETEYTLSGIDLRTGSIKVGEDVSFSVSSGFSWKDKGIVSDLELKGLVRFGPDGEEALFKDTVIQASVSGDFLPKNAEPGEFISSVDLDLDTRILKLHNFEARLFGIRAEGDLESGDLRNGLDIRGHVTVHPFAPANILTRYAPQLPLKDVDGLKSSALATSVQVTEEGIFFDNLLFTLDDITVRGQLGFKGYSNPVFSFALRGDTIDLDRYLPLFRTGTPFIWDDFNLPFFGAFRGNGTVRADGFQVLNTLVSDIRLNINATDAGISLDAGAMREGVRSLGGKVEIGIGSTGKGNVPTLALSASLDAESPKQGFVFLQQPPLSIGGGGMLQLKVKVAAMQCPPEARSIFILRHLDGSAVISLGQGVARVATASNSPLELSYSKADLQARVSPTSGNTDEFWKCNLAASIKTRGGKDIETLNATVDGPLSTAIDAVHVKSTGMTVNGYLASSLLPPAAKRLTVGGTVGFDSKNAAVDIRDAVVQAFETSIGGNVALTGLDKRIMGQGNITIAQADPKRIVYLLTGKSIATTDPEALKKASFQSFFTADDHGFTLSQCEGELDGMPVKGHVVGTGYEQPMLAFSMAAGAFNLDRYLPPKKAPTLREQREGKTPQSEPVDLPLKFLRYLKLNGKMAFNEFTLSKVRTEALSGNVTANEGLIHISKIVGRRHGGSLNADLKGEAQPTTLSTQLSLQVKDMQAGPLMAEMTGREYVRGETDIKMDLRSRGKTDEDIVKNLSGSASVRITNGSFKFTGYDAPEKVVKQTSGQALYHSAPVATQSRTTFRKVVSDFSVLNGVFTIDKFRLEAPPILQAYGTGNFSLADNSIDIAIRNDFVAVPSVTLLLKGKLTDPKVEVPTGRIINDTVFNILSLPKKSFEFLRDLF